MRTITSKKKIQRFGGPAYDDDGDVDNRVDVDVDADVDVGVEGEDDVDNGDDCHLILICLSRGLGRQGNQSLLDET